MNKQRVLHSIGLAIVAGLGWLAVSMKDSPHWWAPAAATLAAALVVQLPKVAPSIFGPMVLLAMMSAPIGCFLFQAHPISPTAPDGGFADASANTRFVDCTDQAVHTTVVNILPAVETALALQDYEVELAKLVGRFGLDEVACAVRWVIDKASGQAVTTGDPLELDKANHGRAWMAKQPVTFQ